MQASGRKIKDLLPAAGRAALALALLIAAGGVAQAQSNGDWYDTKLLRNILGGVGLTRGRDGVIDYRERSPLVIPPDRSLPPPQRKAALNRNPAWPKDPDVEAARAAARERPILSFEDESRALLPSELNKGRRGRRQPRTASAGRPKTNLFEPLTPTQLGYKGGLFGSLFNYKNDDVAKFTGEPPRVNLIDPPAGYRTPSPDQPYGLTKRTKKAKADNPYVTHGEVKPESTR